MVIKLYISTNCYLTLLTPKCSKFPSTDRINIAFQDLLGVILLDRHYTGVSQSKFNHLGESGYSYNNSKLTIDPCSI